MVEVEKKTWTWVSYKPINLISVSIFSQDLLITIKILKKLVSYSFEFLLESFFRIDFINATFLG